MPIARRCPIEYDSSSSLQDGMESAWQPDEIAAALQTHIDPTSVPDLVSMPVLPSVPRLITTAILQDNYLRQRWHNAAPEPYTSQRRGQARLPLPRRDSSLIPSTEGVDIGDCPKIHQVYQSPVPDVRINSFPFRLVVFLRSCYFTGRKAHVERHVFRHWILASAPGHDAASIPAGLVPVALCRLFKIHVVKSVGGSRSSEMMYAVSPSCCRCNAYDWYNHDVWSGRLCNTSSDSRTGSRRRR